MWNIWWRRVSSRWRRCRHGCVNSASAGLFDLECGLSPGLLWGENLITASAPNAMKAASTTSAPPKRRFCRVGASG
jgi:hypothetical protein